MDFLDLKQFNLSSINDTFQKYGVKILKHENYVTPVDENTCGFIFSVDQEDRCQFIQDTPICIADMQMINYMAIFFCKLTEEDTAKIYFLCFWMILFTAYLFLVMALASEFVFCPGLVVMAKLLHLSESVAGVTLLAFGNTADNILGNIIKYNEDMTTITAEMLGGAIFISCMVAGCVCMIRSFYLIVKSFVRDVIFYIIAVCWIFYILYDECIEIWEAFSLLAIYIIYITIVISSQVYANFQSAYADRDFFKMDTSSKTPRTRGKSIIILEEFRLQDPTEYVHESPPNEVEDAQYDEGIFADFLQYMKPFSMEEFFAVKLKYKLWAITKTPAVIFLRLFIPVVDYQSPRSGWCKLLNSVQCITSPLYVAFILKVGTTVVFYIGSFGIQIWMIIVLLGWIPMTISLTKTVVKTNPKFYDYIAFTSFIASISTIHFISLEIGAIVATLGQVFQLSNNFLGLTALAWGKGVGELVSNINVAKQGLSMMAFSACFGGPMLNIVLGAGIAFFIRTMHAEDHKSAARPGDLSKNCVAFLCYSLASTLIMISLTRFQVRRSHGAFLVIFYLTFLLFCILGEKNIIHPYGTDHNLDPADSVQDILLDIP